MESIPYSDFSLSLHEASVATRLPLGGSIEITRRCPAACLHCYNNLPMSDVGARRSELTPAEHCRILDEIVEAGCLWLLYTGGEPLARRDFPEIYYHARSRGLIITIFTNGLLVTPAIADRLAECPPFSIEVTLYGRTPETYERVTRLPGSFARCMEGIRLLRERRLPVRLKAVVIAVNRHEIWEMKRFAEQELGLSFRFDAMMNPRIDGSLGPLDVRLTPAEVVELDMMDGDRLEQWGAFCDRFGGPVHPPECADQAYHCGGGVNSFAIDPEGRLSLCVLSQSDVYDLRRGSFGEGWGQFLRKVRQRARTGITRCAGCGIQAMCGMCPALAELESGNPETPVEFLCEVAHLRSCALQMEVPFHGECAFCPGGERHPEILRAADRLRAGACGSNLIAAGRPDRRNSRHFPSGPPMAGEAGLVRLHAE